MVTRDGNMYALTEVGRDRVFGWSPALWHLGDRRRGLRGARASAGRWPPPADTDGVALNCASFNGTQLDVLDRCM
jgi:hypothetical protein